jgi:hypothetical protein
MRKQLLLLPILGFLWACVHQGASNGTAWISQQDLAHYTDKTLNLFRNHEPIRLNGGVTGVVGEYDPTEPILYHLQDGNPPKPSIQLRSKLLTNWIDITVVPFDLGSGQVIDLTQGSIKMH